MVQTIILTINHCIVGMAISRTYLKICILIDALIWASVIVGH